MITLQGIKKKGTDFQLLGCLIRFRFLFFIQSVKPFNNSFNVSFSKSSMKKLPVLLQKGANLAPSPHSSSFVFHCSSSSMFCYCGVFCHFSLFCYSLINPSTFLPLVSSLLLSVSLFPCPNWYFPPFFFLQCVGVSQFNIEFGRKYGSINLQASNKFF